MIKDKEDNWTHEQPVWESGLTSGMEQRIMVLEEVVDSLGLKLQSGCPCGERHEHLIKKDNTNLVEYLKIAHVGLLPGATVNQQNLGSYAIRSALKITES